jgi:hypothetical protein
MGRSATIVLCYLMKSRRWTAERALSYVKSKRNDVAREVVNFPCVRQFTQHLVATGVLSAADESSSAAAAAPSSTDSAAAEAQSHAKPKRK